MLRHTAIGALGARWGAISAISALLGACAPMYLVGKSDEELRATRPSSLCMAHHDFGYERATRELQRRELFDAHTWSLIRQKQVAPGMHEYAIVCAWGLPKHANTSSNAESLNEYHYIGPCSGCGHKIVYARERRVVEVRSVATNPF